MENLGGGTDNSVKKNWVMIEQNLNIIKLTPMHRKQHKIQGFRNKVVFNSCDDIVVGNMKESE